MSTTLRCHDTVFGVLALLSLSSLGGCGGDGESGTGGHDPGFSYELDEKLHINELQAKGTHNSYHIAKPDIGIKALEYTHTPLDVQLRDEGVRQFELDTHFNYLKEEFEVYHLGTIDEGSTCRRFVDCLTALKTWSDQNPAHHPLFVQIEPKDVPAESDAEDYFGRLEGEVLSVWPRDRVLTPDDVRGSASTLRDAITKNGWPTLAHGRGKLIFFVDNSDIFRELYTHGKKDLDGRLMFIDADITDPWAGVLLVNDPTNAQKIADAVNGGFIVRTRADADNEEPFAGDVTHRDMALASGAQLISTDYPVPVQGVNYVVEIPGGAPSRCNPLLKPADCKSEDIEDPKFIK